MSEGTRTRFRAGFEPERWRVHAAHEFDGGPLWFSAFCGFAKDWLHGCFGVFPAPGCPGVFHLNLHLLPVSQLRKLDHNHVLRLDKKRAGI